MKFKEKIKDNRLTVRASTSFHEEIYGNEIEIFSRQNLRGFLKPQMVKKDVVEYYGPVGVTLAQRLKKPLNKHDFLFIIEQIVLLLQKIEVNHLNLKFVLFDINRVYVNEVTKEVNFMYLPYNKSNSVDMVSFIDSIIYSIKLDSGEDMNYVSQFTYFFRGLNSFKTDAIEKYIEKEDPNIIYILKKQLIGQSGFISDKQSDVIKHEEEKRRREREAEEYKKNTTRKSSNTRSDFLFEDTGVLVEDTNQDDEGTRSFGFNDFNNEETTTFNNVSNYYNDFEETTEMSNYGNEETTVMVQNHMHYPTLYRKSTNEIIDLNKPVFRVGKERSYVDYFVNNNPHVSRSHADIITRGNRYFIKDLGAKNKTYVNNEEIFQNIEIELHDGDVIRMANEEFVFNI